MATPKVMKLLNPYTGLMECQVCGARHAANTATAGRGYYRGSWQCRNGCKLPDAAVRDRVAAGGAPWRPK
jgi:hypothetical protein